MKLAVFPGSFDPFTLGHMDVLTSALQLFDKIVIAVGCNSLKNNFLSAQNRVKLIENAIKPLLSKGYDITVISYTGMTVELCKKLKINFIVRGLRTTTDFELESAVSQANKQMAPEIVSVFIPASNNYSHISSTVVRDIIMNGGDASGFLPDNINIQDYLTK
jgi:pantetheine-phosphate adenylyltransferase